jgi:hypothetical protein
MPVLPSSDDRYLALISDALAVCREYRPKLGHGRRIGYSLEEFQQIYGQDPFYSWVGLNSPLVYAAHRAAGGMTSVYRQLGIGCERLFQNVLKDTLGLTDEQAKWSYSVPSMRGKSRTLSLDGRIPLEDLANTQRAPAVRDWVKGAGERVKLEQHVLEKVRGVVFEVRQGYKSKDSKRQNADIANAANAYAHDYLPAVVLLSTQMDADIAERYVRSQWLLLTGTLTGTPVDSTYVFCREVLGYDLAAFFQRNSKHLRRDIESIIKGLLS